MTIELSRHENVVISMQQASFANFRKMRFDMRDICQLPVLDFDKLRYDINPKKTSGKSSCYLLAQGLFKVSHKGEPPLVLK